MKKYLALALALVMVLGLVNIPVANANTEPARFNGKIFVDSQRLTLENLPIVHQGRVLVPMREMAKAVGAYVHYDQASHSAFILHSGVTQKSLKPGAKGDALKIYSNNTLVSSPTLVSHNGVTYMDIREFAAAAAVYSYEDVLSTNFNDQKKFYTDESIYGTVYLLTDKVALQDGEYYAQAASDSRGWAPFVRMTVEGGKIVAAEYNEVFTLADNATYKVGEVKSTSAYATSWKTRVEATFPNLDVAAAFASYGTGLVDKQVPANVDAVTGATGAYKSFTVIASRAIAKAKIGEVYETANFEYKDGSYKVVNRADERGWASELTLEIKDGKIVAITFDEFNAEGVGKIAGGAYVPNWQTRVGVEGFDPVKLVNSAMVQLLANQDPNMVDSMTGATRWTTAVRRLTGQALNQAKITEIPADAEKVYVFTSLTGKYDPAQLLLACKGKEVVAFDYSEYRDGVAKKKSDSYLNNWATRMPDANPREAMEKLEELFQTHKNPTKFDAVTGATSAYTGSVELFNRAMEYLGK